jgi:hypothetical protein
VAVDVDDVVGLALVVAEDVLDERHKRHYAARAGHAVGGGDDQHLYRQAPVAPPGGVSLVEGGPQRSCRA